MVRSRAKHDHYKGSLIEYFDVTNPAPEPAGNKRVHGPGVDVRKDKRLENERTFNSERNRKPKRRSQKYSGTPEEKAAKKEAAKKRRTITKASEKSRKKMRERIKTARQRHKNGEITAAEMRKAIAIAEERCRQEELRHQSALRELVEGYEQL